MNNSQTLTLPAPAKVNRFLHVLNRRPDGYHNLQTAFQFVDLCDEISFQKRDDSSIHLISPLQSVATHDNLIVKAAQLLQQHTGYSTGINISLTKNIPMGAGLGGGSSDAATTLIALNQLWQLGLSQESLLNLATQLGADVPIFIYGQAAWAEGIGNRFTPQSPDEPWYLLIQPPIQIETAALFQQLSVHPPKNRPVQPTTAFNTLSNDFEALVIKQFPHLQTLVETLKPHTQLRLTGTGSVMYGTFDTRDEASTIASLAPANCHTFVTKGKNTSPLFEALDGQLWGVAKW